MLLVCLTAFTDRSTQVAQEFLDMVIHCRILASSRPGSYFLERKRQLACLSPRSLKQFP